MSGHNWRMDGTPDTEVGRGLGQDPAHFRMTLPLLTFSVALLAGALANVPAVRAVVVSAGLAVIQYAVVRFLGLRRFPRSETPKFVFLYLSGLAALAIIASVVTFSLKGLWR